MSTEAPPSPCGSAHTHSLGCFRPPRSGVSGRPAPAALGCFRPPAEPCPCRTRSPPPPAPAPSPRAATPRPGAPQVRPGQGRGQPGGASLALALRGEFPLRDGFARFCRRSRVSAVAAPFGGSAVPAAESSAPGAARGAGCAGLCGEGRAVVSARLGRSGAWNCSKSSCRCGGKSED